MDRPPWTDTLLPVSRSMRETTGLVAAKTWELITHPTLAWEKSWEFMHPAPGNLTKWERFVRGVKHFPGDVVFERSEQAGTILDFVPMIPLLFLFNYAWPDALLINWGLGEIPLVVNIVRSVMHPNPNALPGQWWKRDWTYASRPRARQPASIAAEPELPMELDPHKWIPKPLRWLTTQANIHSRWSLPGLADDWLCMRSRVVGAVMDHFILVAGLVGGLALGPLMIVNRLIVFLPGGVGFVIGLANKDIRRALRGGVFQRAGDVVIAPQKTEEAPRTLPTIGVDTPATPAQDASPAVATPPATTVDIVGRAQRERQRGLAPKAPEPPSVGGLGD